jgi:DNA sulfur modification protein DndB
MKENEGVYLGPIHADPRSLRRESAKRRKQFDEKAIPVEEITTYEANGWIVSRKLKKATRIRHEKPLDERLENRFWMLLYKMGYPEMNSGRKFTVLIERKGAEPLRKQIDVLAKDEETVVVAECKASDKVGKRSLQKDVEEFANLKGPIAQAIRKHYGEAFRPKIIWLFVTENIIWSKPDKERACGENIRVITERELRYYSQIAEHLGKAARYQFLAEFLKDQKIPELTGKSVPAIRGKLGGKEFYCFVTTPRHLLKISFVNHRSLNDPEGAPTYQRLISRSRMRAIGDYIKDGGYFPTNLLVNFTRPVRFDKVNVDGLSGVAFGQLYLPDRYQSAWIIDGQHRLYGFSPIDDVYLDQNIIVVAFEQLPKDEEANLFVTINHEQKSVPKHLLDDLEGELKWGSEVPSERIGSLAAKLINLINTDVDEPFYNRITQQGIPSTNKTCLTIPALKDALRRSGLLGRPMMNNTNYELGPLCGAKDSETLERARCGLNLYFSNIRNARLSHWDIGREGVLCTNVAVQAYIKFLESLIRYWELNTATDSRQMEIDEVLAGIEEYLSPVLDFVRNADEAAMQEAFQVPFGSGGPPQYYFRLCRLVKEKYPDFKPDGMEEWETEQSAEKIMDADRKLKDIIVEMQKYIFSTFKSVFGEIKESYWEKGVLDKEIKAAAYKRSMEYELEVRLPKESYLDVIDYKKIVEHKQNWLLFKPVFDIPEPGEKGHAKNLKWLDRINELRRVQAHPSDKRHYKVADFEYIDFVHKEFFERLVVAQNNPLPEGEPAMGGEDG